MRKLQAVVLSDLHFGSGIYSAVHALLAVAFLKKHQPGTIIVNGDLFDKKRRPKQPCPLIQFLRSFSGKKVFIWGNHDHDHPEISMVPEYILQAEQGNVYIAHGHHGDSSHHFFKQEIIDLAALFVAKLFGKIALFRSMQKPVYRFLGSRLARYMAQKAKKNGCSRAVAGHSHYAEFQEVVIRDQVISYYNCGALVAGVEPSCLGIYTDGEMKIFYLKHAS